MNTSTLSDNPEMDILLRPSYYRDNLFTEYRCMERCTEDCRVEVYLADRVRVLHTCKRDPTQMKCFYTGGRK